jgi:hypothetical protein
LAVDFFAQVADARFDDVGVRVETAVPDAVEEAERRTNTAKREESARQLVAFAKANLERKHYGSRRIANVFIGGHFNTDPDQAAYAGESTIQTLVDAGYADAFAGEPVEKRYTMEATRWYPASVFDYLFHKGTAALSHPEVAPKQYTSDHRMVSIQVRRMSSSYLQRPPVRRGQAAPAGRSVPVQR